jgi:hypothetical protein
MGPLLNKAFNKRVREPFKQGREDGVQIQKKGVVSKIAPVFQRGKLLWGRKKGGLAEEDSMVEMQHRKPEGAFGGPLQGKNEVVNEGNEDELEAGLARTQPEPEPTDTQAKKKVHRASTAALNSVLLLSVFLISMLVTGTEAVFCNKGFYDNLSLRGMDPIYWGCGHDNNCADGLLGYSLRPYTDHHCNCAW